MDPIAHRDSAAKAAMQTLVLDDAVGRRLAALLLKRLNGVDPCLVEDASAAIDVVRRQNVDLILIDLGYCGADLIEQLRGQVSQRPAQPWIVAMSASDDLDGATSCSGCDAIIRKPLSLQSLSALLSSIPSARQTSASDFNADSWREIVQLFKAAGAAELVAVMKSDLPVQQQRLADAVAQRDWPAMKTLAHTLRGTSLQFGADSLAELCARAEQAAGAADADAALRDCAQVIERHARLVADLDAALQREAAEPLAQ